MLRQDHRHISNDLSLTFKTTEFIKFSPNQCSAPVFQVEASNQCDKLAFQ